MLTYSIIRKEYQNVVGVRLHNRLMLLISPLFTMLFVKYNIIPNIVTFLMVIFGIVGAVFFAIPNTITQIIGIVFIFLWYGMDCSDGEVARITKKFSLYGKELDFTAHAINHPLYTLAFVLFVINSDLVFAFIIVGIGLLDTMYRSLLSFKIIKSLKEPIEASKSNPIKQKFKITKIHSVIYQNLNSYPQFAMFFPIVLLIDERVAFYYAILVLVAFVFMVITGMKSWLKYIIYR